MGVLISLQLKVILSSNMILVEMPHCPKCNQKNTHTLSLKNKTHLLYVSWAFPCFPNDEHDEQDDPKQIAFILPCIYRAIRSSASYASFQCEASKDSGSHLRDGFASKMPISAIQNHPKSSKINQNHPKFHDLIGTCFGTTEEFALKGEASR